MIVFMSKPFARNKTINFYFKRLNYLVMKKNIKKITTSSKVNIIKNAALLKLKGGTILPPARTKGDID